MKPKRKAVELTEGEKMVLNLLKDQTGLSNKKWDKAIKGLTKNKLARVEKTEAGLSDSVEQSKVIIKIIYVASFPIVGPFVVTELSPAYFSPLLSNSFFILIAQVRNEYIRIK